jgi:hypothetical protein
MPRGKLRPTLEEVKALLAEDRDFLRPLERAGFELLVPSWLERRIRAVAPFYGAS